MKNIRTTSSPLSIQRLYFSAFFVIILTACSGFSKDFMKAGVDAELTGALLMVRFEGIVDPPPFIRLDIGHSEKPEKVQFAGKINQNFQGDCACYLVALSLPPGNYILEGLRGLKDLSAKPIVINLPFVVERGGPGYMGRILINSNSHSGKFSLRIEDHYEEDLAKFRAAFGVIKDVAIARSIIYGGEVNTTSASDSRAVIDENKVLKSHGRKINFTPLTSAASSLLLNGDRSEFANFLRAHSPRAFATNHAGAWGWAEGSNAANIALSQCSKKIGAGNSSECQLFAINDIIVQYFDTQDLRSDLMANPQDYENSSGFHGDEALKLNLERWMLIPGGFKGEVQHLQTP